VFDKLHPAFGPQAQELLKMSADFELLLDDLLPRPA
jgi:hypothetical protein